MGATPGGHAALGARNRERGYREAITFIFVAGICEVRWISNVVYCDVEMQVVARR